MTHKHAELMKVLARQILDGVEKPWELWESRFSIADKWLSCTCLPGFDEDREYRLKQKYININGFEVPEPCQDKLNLGDSFYAPYPFKKDFYFHYFWRASQDDFNALRNGVVHLTAEAAMRHGEALYSFTQQKDSVEITSERSYNYLRGRFMRPWVSIQIKEEGSIKNVSFVSEVHIETRFYLSFWFSLDIPDSEILNHSEVYDQFVNWFGVLGFLEPEM